MSTVITFIQQNSESPSHSNQTRKRNKSCPNLQERSKTLFPDDMILYIENPKDSTLKLLELIYKFNKVADYNISLQKSVAFLYTNTEAAKREIKRSITFTTSPKWIRYLGINLTKDVKDLYSEN